MEARGLLHIPKFHYMEIWIGLRVNLDIVEKEQIADPAWNKIPILQ
jgi:hypothetical protein